MVSDVSRFATGTTYDCVRVIVNLSTALSRSYGCVRAQNTSRFVLDGEVVAFKGRRTSFERLQGRIGLTDPDKARGPPGSRSSTTSLI